MTLDSGGTVRPLIVRGWLWSADSQAFLAQRGLRRVDAVAGQVVCRTANGVEAPSDGVKSAADGSDGAVAAGAVATAPGADMPTVVVVHALTGDMTVGGDGGWWAPLVGPGKAIDPTRHRVLCFNNLGSCYGTSGPADDGFPGGPINTWDQSRVLLRALDALGIERVALLTGGSLGAMVTLALAALAPERVERIAPIAGCLAASSWIIGFNHVQRRAIELSPGGTDGLALARQIAMLTYRAEAGLDQRQGRQLAVDGAGRSYRMQTYLDYQGDKLVDRFVRETYLAMMDAMDHHDVHRPPVARGDGEAWSWINGESGIDRISANCFAIGIDTDQLFLPVHSEAIAAALSSRGRVAEVGMIRSPHGHDAFLIEWDQLDGFLRRALALPPGKTS